MFFANCLILILLCISDPVSACASKSAKYPSYRDFQTLINNPDNRKAVLTEMEYNENGMTHTNRQRFDFVKRAAHHFKTMDQRCQLELVQSNAGKYCGIVGHLAAFFLNCDITDFYYDDCR